MLVDLFTTSRELDDIMLTEYPGLIFEEGHEIDTSDSEQKIYCFYYLNYAELFKFLSRFKTRARYEFEIRDKDGKIVEVNQLKCQNQA